MYKHMIADNFDDAFRDPEGLRKRIAQKLFPRVMRLLHDTTRTRKVADAQGTPKRDKHRPKKR